MDNTPTKTTSKTTKQNATTIALATAIGVVLAVSADNWSLLAIAVAVGCVFAGMPLVGRRKKQSTDAPTEGRDDSTPTTPRS